jgi:hypothetical protein
MCRIGFLISEGFQIMDLATPSVFVWANIVAGEPFYMSLTARLDVRTQIIFTAAKR